MQQRILCLTYTRILFVEHQERYPLLGKDSQIQPACDQMILTRQEEMIRASQTNMFFSIGIEYQFLEQEEDIGLDQEEESL